MGANRRDLSYHGVGNTRDHLAAIDAGFRAGHVASGRAGLAKRAAVPKLLDESAASPDRVKKSAAGGLASIF